MKNIILYLFIVIFIVSCNNNDDTTVIDYEDFFPEEIPDNDQYQLKFYKNSEVESTTNGSYTNAQIVSGNNLVFEYKYVFEDDPILSDDEYTEIILFEVNPDVNEFFISDEELLNANSMLGTICFCAPSGFFNISDGWIKGKKLNENEWQIDLSVSYDFEYREYTKMISEIFTAE